MASHILHSSPSGLRCTLSVLPCTDIAVTHTKHQELLGRLLIHKAGSLFSITMTNYKITLIVVLHILLYSKYFPQRKTHLEFLTLLHHQKIYLPFHTNLQTLYFPVQTTAHNQPLNHILS